MEDADDPLRTAAATTSDISVTCAIELLSATLIVFPRELRNYPCYRCGRRPVDTQVGARRMVLRPDIQESVNPEKRSCRWSRRRILEPSRPLRAG